MKKIIDANPNSNSQDIAETKFYLKILSVNNRKVKTQQLIDAKKQKKWERHESFRLKIIEEFTFDGDIFKITKDEAAVQRKQAALERIKRLTTE